MINYRKGNMFDHPVRDEYDVFVFLHGVNCQGVMGSGVAMEFRSRFPKAFGQYLEDVQKLRAPGDNLLGSISVWSQESLYNQKHYISGFTQENYGKDGKRYASYAAVFSVLMKTFEYANRLAMSDDQISIVMPKIASGLGGCDWKYIASAIDALSIEYPNIVVYVYELNL